MSRENFEGLRPDEWRRAMHKSQEECAKAIGIHPNTYRGWEEKPELFSVNGAQKFSEFLGISIDLIIFRSKEQQNVAK